MPTITRRGKTIGTALGAFLACAGGAAYYFTGEPATQENPVQVTRDTALRDINETIDQKIVQIRKPERLRNECTYLPEKFNAFMSGAGIKASMTGDYKSPAAAQNEYGLCTLSINGTPTWSMNWPDSFAHIENQSKFAKVTAGLLVSESDLRKFRANMPGFLDTITPAP